MPAFTPTVKWPFSGDVSQIIAPWTSWFSAFGSQIGLININLGRSSAPEVERDILDEVGSYGRQLGRIGDAMAVLLEHFDTKQPLTPDEEKAIRALRVMLDDIDGVKTRHNRLTIKS